jgi:hypothetical protein
MPKNKTSQITQSELELCFAVHRAANTIAYLLGKKLDQGATVEPGYYTVEGGVANEPPPANLSAFDDMGIEIRTDLAIPEIFTGKA